MIARIRENRVVLDMLTVADEQLEAVVASLAAIAADVATR